MWSRVNISPLPGFEPPVFQFRRDELKVFSSPLSQNGLRGAPLPTFPTEGNGELLQVWEILQTPGLQQAIPPRQSLVFERKILRRIFEPKKQNQTWRIKMNEELDKIIKQKYS
jgi:hypothetical protein